MPGRKSQANSKEYLSSGQKSAREAATAAKAAIDPLLKQAEAKRRL